MRDQLAPLEAHDAIANGVRLRFWRGGPVDAPTLLLLHGFPQTSLIWRRVAPALAERYQVVAVDLRGYGDSEKPPAIEANDQRSKAADVRALAGRLGLRRPLLVGHDRGARVARRFALDFPDDLAGAALLDILPAEWVYDQFSAAEVARRHWHWVFNLVPDLPELLISGREEAYLQALFVRSPGVLELLRADGAWDAYLRALRQPGAVAAALADYRATFSIDVPRYREERAAGVHVRSPLLLLWGARGNLRELPVLDIWRAVADDVRGAELAGCGHYLPEERPEEVTAQLLRFAGALFGGQA